MYNVKRAGNKEKAAAYVFSIFCKSLAIGGSFPCLVLRLLRPLSLSVFQILVDMPSSPPFSCFRQADPPKVLGIRDYEYSFLNNALSSGVYPDDEGLRKTSEDCRRTLNAYNHPVGAINTSLSLLPPKYDVHSLVSNRCDKMPFFQKFPRKQSNDSQNIGPWEHGLSGVPWAFNRRGNGGGWVKLWCEADT